MSFSHKEAQKTQRTRTKANRLFSLAPIGGEGRGEGAGRPASQSASEFNVTASGPKQSAASFCSSARPLTLTLSPGGGEGTRASWWCALVLGLLAACTPPQKSASKSGTPVALKGVTAIAVFPTELPLIAGAAAHRVVVTATDKDGFEVTAPAKFVSDNPAVASVSADGKVRPLAPGTATITAKLSGKSASAKVTVRRAGDSQSPSATPDANSATNAPERRLEAAGTGPQLSFLNDVLPILSKAGCNLGSCHAKADGQNGFKLTIFAYDPRADYLEIVKDARGRRVFPALPEESLLLKKASLAVPHDGGLRIERDSEEFRTVASWIAQGMTYSRPGEPTLTGIAVFPKERRYRRETRQPLLVQARYTDGSVRDVTELSEFLSNEKTLATVDDEGVVSVGKFSGEGAIVARFLGSVAVSTVMVPSDRVLPAEQFAALPVSNDIDRLVYERLQKLGHLPSAGCTDAEFLRRASLDTTGTLPTSEETMAFLEDKSPDKRAKLIDRLLDHPAWADHWAVKWGDLVRGNPSRVGVKPVFLMDQWLRDSFRQNKPYDQFVRELLTAQGSTHHVGPPALFRDKRTPEDASGFVSQVFLGVRLECAKCHHHPNEKWDQKDYYQLAAFFSGTRRKGQGISAPISGEPEYIWATSTVAMKHPVTGEDLKPRAPDGPEVTIATGSDPRAALVDWMVQPENPLFARAAVNRVWNNFFGRGIVDPVDDFRASNPPSNQPLLDWLARDFIVHKFDLKHLMRTILRSHTYQLSSAANETNVGDTKNFSRSYRRRLPAEVLLDAVTQVTGTRDNFSGLPEGSRALQTWNHKLDSEFMDAFGRPNSSAECPCDRDARPSMVQALHLMNSTRLNTKVTATDGRARLLAASKSTEEQIVTDLYLSAYNRKPTSEELALALKAFTAKNATRQSATEDILWALLNSAEFVFNH